MRDQLNQENLVSNFTLRTENAYNNNTAAIEENPDSSALLEFKERYVLNEYFYHVANGLSPDLAHDLLEESVADAVMLSFLSLEKGYLN